MAIQLLDQDTINKIAAGEVVERPSSVVKELVENAVDAGATAITVEIKDGGISLIRVTDNGCGISKDEISTAFLRHSTSKIKSIEDLFTVSSLGFRGEALSSIASVAQVELITKTQDSLTGSRYCIEGGEEKSFDEVGAPDGTTFLVRNLFYNTPVRRKFLKTAATEGGYVNALVEHLALSHPDISFRFISNNQNRLHTSGNMNLKDIIYNIYGREITANLIEVSGRTQDIEISGFIAKPSVCRGNRSCENYFINGRYIKSGIITKAIEDAYKGRMMPHNYPFTVLHFKMDPSMIDVNVHPAKMEIRFSRNDFVVHYVQEALREALKNSDLASHVSLEADKNGQQLRSTEAARKTYGRETAFMREDSDKKTTVQTAQTVQTVQPEQFAQFKQFEQFSRHTQEKTDIRLPEPFEAVRSAQMASEDNAASMYARKEAAQQLSLLDTPLISEKGRQSYRIIGQLFATYWLIEHEDKFYIMDQHAAHEKILYERLMKKLEEQNIDTQMLLLPVVIELRQAEAQVLEENLDAFKRLGYEIEPFGAGTYKMTGVPAGLPETDYRQLLIDLLDGLTENHKGNMERITEKAASISCKAAVKGNHAMSLAEAQALMEQLMQAENPYNCPHGRPTLIMMSKYEIEKKFKRIV